MPALIKDFNGLLVPVYTVKEIEKLFQKKTFDEDKAITIPKELFRNFWNKFYANSGNFEEQYKISDKFLMEVEKAK